MAAPTPTPTIEASASGVLKTRSSPNCCGRPSVTLKTPPFGPATSSPNTITRPSRSISSISAARIAWR